jgi:hypothetical protein
VVPARGQPEGRRRYVRSVHASESARCNRGGESRQPVCCGTAGHTLERSALE